MEYSTVRQQNIVIPILDYSSVLYDRICLLYGFIKLQVYKLNYKRRYVRFYLDKMDFM